MSSKRSTQSQTAAAPALKAVSTNAESQDHFSQIAGDILKDAIAQDPNAGAVIDEGQAPAAPSDPAAAAVTPAATDGEENDDDADDAPAAAPAADKKNKPAAEVAAPVTAQDDDYQEFDDLNKPATPAASAEKPAGTPAPAAEPPVEPTNAEAEEFRALMADPVMSRLIEAKRSGADVFAAINQLRWVDFSKMSAEEKIRMDCQKLGITDEAQIEQELEAFEAMTPRQKQAEINRITSQLEGEQKAQMEKIVSASSDLQKRKADIQNNFRTGVKNLCKDAIGKNFYGITVDEKTAKEIENLLLNKWDLFTPDGQINTVRALSYGLFDLKIRNMLRKQHKSGTNAGRKEILEEVAQPDRMNQSVTNRNENVDDSPENLVRQFVDAN